MITADVTADEVRPGAILAGRYRVERPLGAGGMGVVVAARHISLGHRVAIKYLPQHALKDTEAVERFTREAWAAAQLASPHVVRVTEVASLPSGAPFIVMEYLDGEDLAQLLERRHRVSPTEAVSLVLPVCEAIAEAHSIGIVHRDLKPSNIFCVRTATNGIFTKVLDFGISKLTNHAVANFTLTTTRTALGSPLYMSPEQMHSAKVVDARTDIWALGVILYELVAGCRPFDATSLPELAIKVATTPPTGLRELCPDVPRGFERIVSRCLEKDRTKRYPSVAALATALAAFAPHGARVHAERAERVSAAAKAQPGPSKAQNLAQSTVVGSDHALKSRVQTYAVPVLLLAAAVAAALGIMVSLESSGKVPALTKRNLEPPPGVRARAGNGLPEASQPPVAPIHSREARPSVVASSNPAPEPALGVESSPPAPKAGVVPDAERASNVDAAAASRARVVTAQPARVPARRSEPAVKGASAEPVLPAARSDRTVSPETNPRTPRSTTPRLAGENVAPALPRTATAPPVPVAPQPSETQELGGRL